MPCFNFSKGTNILYLALKIAFLCCSFADANIKPKAINKFTKNTMTKFEYLNDDRHVKLRTYAITHSIIIKNIACKYIGINTISGTVFLIQ